MKSMKQFIFLVMFSESILAANDYVRGREIHVIVGVPITIASDTSFISFIKTRLQPKKMVKFRSGEYIIVGWWRVVNFGQ